MDPLVESYIDAVVKIDSMRLVFFGILKKIMAHAADCENAFLHHIIHEKYYIIENQKLGELEEFMLLVLGALLLIHGLQVTAARCHEFLSETLKRWVIVIKKTFG